MLRIPSTSAVGFPRTLLVLLFGALSLAPAVSRGDGAASGSGFLGTHTLKSTVTVAAGPYKHEFHPPLKVTVSAGAKDGELVFDVERLGYTCRLKGQLKAADEVEIPAGQTCAQSISGTGFSADLVGTVQSGSAHLTGKTLKLTTSLTVSGTVKSKTLPLPLTIKGGAREH